MQRNQSFDQQTPDKQALANLSNEYNENGFITAVPVISRESAAEHRQRLEQAEQTRDSLHYFAKVHTLFQSPCELATAPQVLDIVEQLIGPNILLFNVTYIIKEANTPSHVSWHQDLTYWGLSHDDQVSMWLALSPATGDTGCMKMLPGTHKSGKLEHQPTEDQNNVLLQGQTVSGIDDSQSVLCPLEPGEASFHHGWTLHASSPNTGNDRRIGLNVQYIATHVRQTKHDLDTALLVRGEDRYNHFGTDIPATSDFDPAAVERHRQLQRLYEETAGTS